MIGAGSLSEIQISFRLRPNNIPTKGGAGCFLDAFTLCAEPTDKLGNKTTRGM